MIDEHGGQRAMLRRKVIRQSRSCPRLRGVWALNFCFFVVICFLVALTSINVDRSVFKEDFTKNLPKPNLVHQRLYEIQVCL